MNIIRLHESIKLIMIHINKSFIKNDRMPSKKIILILILIIGYFLISIPFGMAHIIGGFRKDTNGITVQFIADPAFVIQNEEANLVFSIQNTTTGKGLEGISVIINIYDDINLIQSYTDIEIIEGDFSFTHKFKEKGIYEIEVEILSEKQTVSTIFLLQVTTKSLMEDITFYIILGISIIIIMLIIINRVSHINKK